MSITSRNYHIIENSVCKGRLCFNSRFLGRHPFFKRESIKNIQMKGKIKIVSLNLDTQFAESNCA